MLYRNICKSYRKKTEATYPLVSDWSQEAVDYVQGILPRISKVHSDNIFFATINYVVELAVAGIHVSSGVAIQMGTYNDDPNNTDFPQGDATNYLINHPHGVFRPSVLHYIYLLNNYILGDTFPSHNPDEEWNMNRLPKIISLAREMCLKAQILQNFNAYQIAVACIREVRGKKEASPITKDVYITDFKRISVHSSYLYQGRPDRQPISGVEVDITTIKRDMGPIFVKGGTCHPEYNVSGGLLTEISVYRSVKSEHIPKLFGVADKKLSLILEYAGVKPSQDWRVIATCVTKALNRLHNNGIVHRDISSSNILSNNVSPAKACVKLTDFGMSNFCAIPMIDKQLLLGGSYITTAAYRAPEVWSRQHYDWRVDIWSLGMVLLEILKPKSLPCNLEQILDLFSTAEKLACGYYPYIFRNETIDTSLRVGLRENIPSLVWDCLHLDPFSRPCAIDLMLHPDIAGISDIGYDFIRMVRETAYGNIDTLSLSLLSVYSSYLKSFRIPEQGIYMIVINDKTEIVIAVTDMVFITTTSKLFPSSTLGIYASVDNFNSTIAECNEDGDLKWIFRIFNRVHHLPNTKLTVKRYSL